MQHLNQSEKCLGRISEAYSIPKTLKRARSERVNPKNSLALFASSWKNLKSRHTYHKHRLGGKSGVIVGHPEVHVWVPSQVLQCFIMETSSAVSAPTISARESSKLQRNRAALGSKIRFESRRFDVQKAVAALLRSEGCRPRHRESPC